ncbi:hypothetical protein H5410_036285 [Solanum commersonii]|uniref:Uncharacterized protein n=1 Tax=Solanum commersonii TaxID=4109 RepID=A0A9J5Y4C3_SOLCO|nr:hypothetical protein H5410_036285 [Solanum commersonii]
MLVARAGHYGYKCAISIYKRWPSEGVGKVLLPGDIRESSKSMATLV